MEPAPEPEFSSRRLIHAVYAPSLLHAAGYGMLGPAIPLFASELGVPVATIGLLAAIQAVGAVASNVPAGLWSARFGGRPAMAVGVATSAAGALLLAFAQAPLHLFAAVPLIGIGTAAWATARLAYVAEVAPSAQRGRALAMVGGASRVGMTIGPIAGGLLSEGFGIQAAFAGHAAFCALAFLLVATARRAPGGRQAAPIGSARGRVWSAVVENKGPLARSGTVAISLVMLRATRRILIPLWGQAIGLDLAEIGLAIGLAAALDMTLFYPVGQVMDRWGRKWTIVPCLITISASLALFPLTGDFASFLLVGLLGGFGNGLGSGAIMTMGADLAPEDRRGEFIGVWRLVADSGGVAAPLAVGALAQVLTLGTGFVAVAGVGLAGALFMARRVPDGLRSP